MSVAEKSVVEKLSAIRNRSLVLWEVMASRDAEAEELALLIANKLEGRWTTGSKVVMGEVPEVSLLRVVNLLRASGYRAYCIKSTFSQSLCKGDLVLTKSSGGREKLRKPLPGEKDECRNGVYVSLFKDEE